MDSTPNELIPQLATAPVPQDEGQEEWQANDDYGLPHLRDQQQE